MRAHKVITESVSVATGDKSVRTPEEHTEAESNVIDLKRLAGI